MVQTVIAGGRRALTAAVEGAEDNAPQGKKDLAAKKLMPCDAVVGLSASGTTPMCSAHCNCPPPRRLNHRGDLQSAVHPSRASRRSLSRRKQAPK